MQTLINIEEQQLKKLLFYPHAKNGTEAITKIIVSIQSPSLEKRG